MIKLIGIAVLASILGVRTLVKAIRAKRNDEPYRLDMLDGGALFQDREVKPTVMMVGAVLYTAALVGVCVWAVLRYG